MDTKSSPVIARRLRLSTGAIFAAVVLTGAAVLTVFEIVRPPAIALGPNSAVPLEVPLIPARAIPAHASQMITKDKQASSDDASLKAVRR